MIKLEVGQKVKAHNGQIGTVISFGESWWESPYEVTFGNGHTVWYNKDGFCNKVANTMVGYTIVEILEEDEEPMSVKVRYFTHDSFMYIQNVKESSITVINTWKDEIKSVMDYGSPTKAEEQMLTYSNLFNESINTH